jgi:hypothetical protein
MPRWLHRLWARLFGYFWLPCPSCGRMFGGHEWGDRDGKVASIPSEEQGISTGICPGCTRAGKGYHGYGIGPDGPVWVGPRRG